MFSLLQRSMNFAFDWDKSFSLNTLKKVHSIGWSMIIPNEMILVKQQLSSGWFDCEYINSNVTRLTYNCAHLRSTKESLILEYDIWWYWVIRRRYWLVLGVLGQYNLVMLGIKWYWASKGALMPVYNDKRGDYVGCYHSRTNDNRTRKDRATQPLDHGRLRWAKRRKIFGEGKYLVGRGAGRIKCNLPLRNWENGKKAEICNNLLKRIHQNFVTTGFVQW